MASKNTYATHVTSPLEGIGILPGTYALRTQPGYTGQWQAPQALIATITNALDKKTVQNRAPELVALGLDVVIASRRDCGCPVDVGAIYYAGVRAGVRTSNTSPLNTCTQC